MNLDHIPKILILYVLFNQFYLEKKYNIHIIEEWEFFLEEKLYLWSTTETSWHITELCKEL